MTFVRVPIRKGLVKTFDFTKPNTWNEFLNWVYDLTSHNKPVEHYKIEKNPIFKTDLACPGLVLFR